MGTKYNRYYNDPNIGMAMSNLASIFAPPDPTDELAYAQAAKARLETQGISDLYGLAADPNADAAALDRLGAATGQWSPTSGFGARDIASADRRYGVDVGAGVTMRGQDITSGDNRYNTDSVANTSRLNNANTVRGSVISNLFGPLNPGQVRPEVPDELMGAIGLPSVGSVAGMPEALSTDEVEAQQLLAAIGGGQYGPADAANAAKSDINVEQVVGENGPVFATRGDAVGQQPYINPGSRPRPTNGTAQLPDGTEFPVVQGEDGRWRHAQTGEIAPDTAQVFAMPQPTGSRSDLGLTTGMSTTVQQQALGVISGMQTLDRLQSLIASSPASQGIVGALRGTAQDVIQSGSEIGQLFGGTVQEMAEAAANDPTLRATIGNGYDANIPAIDMLANALAWQYAKAQGGDRVSNEQLKNGLRLVGAGQTWTNTENATSRLNELRQLFQMQGQTLTGLLDRNSPLSAQLAPALAGTQGAAPAPATAAPRQRARNPQTGEMVEFDGQQWVPVQ